MMIQNYPEWANYWACDADGSAYYYQDEPKPDKLRQRWIGGNLCAFHKYMPPPKNWEEELYKKEVADEPRYRPLIKGFTEKDTLTGEVHEPLLRRYDEY